MRLRQLAIAFGIALASVAAAPAALAQQFQPPPESQGDLRVPIETEIQIPTRVANPASPTESEIPGSSLERRVAYLTSGRVEDLAQYIGIVYNFLISIVGLVAAVMMIVGGFQYLTSAGDSGKIGQAKSRITNALIGLVLALGAYTILNTINPALLNLKIPDLRKVGAITYFFPWCEEIEKQGKTVKPLQGDTACGKVGEYQLTATATSTGPCVYAGGPVVQYKQANYQAGAMAKEATGAGDGDDGSEKGETQIGRTSQTLAHTCMQRGGLDGLTLLSQARADRSFVAAVSLPCAAITTEVASAMGYGDLSSACKAWFDATYAYQRIESPAQNAAGNHRAVVYSYCGPAKERPTCVQSDAYCYYADNNNDDGTTKGGCDEENDCGCEGYDESPDVAFTEGEGIKVSTGFFGGISAEKVGAYIKVDGDGPEDYTYHLGPICAWNPCKSYTGPNGRQNFAKGCSGPGISTFVWGVRAVTADCRNK
jgi:hypothetical protein